MSALVIAGTEIHQDQDGRFSLNDFHKAAGGEPKHAPSRFTGTEGCAELVEELNRETGLASLASQRGGATPGTYACKELVYAYAMWVSPKFSLRVIRTFDAVAANDQMIPHDRMLVVAADNFDAARRLAAGMGLEGNQALLSANSMVKAAIGVDVMAMSGIQRLENEAQELNYNPTELGAKLGMSARETNKLLAECGLQRNFEYSKGKKRWEPLPDGKAFAVITDTAKRHSDGKPVQQILWKGSVLELLTNTKKPNGLL